MQPFLKRLDYDSVHSMALRWRIAAGVEIDPAVCFGQPVASTSRIPTRILSTAFVANGEQVDVVADWFRIPTEDVQAAIDFERAIAA